MTFCPSGLSRFTAIEALERLQARKSAPSRAPGCSTLITVAPSSARIMLANGQASARDRSRTFRCCSGFMASPQRKQGDARQHHQRAKHGARIELFLVLQDEHAHREE